MTVLIENSIDLDEIKKIIYRRILSAAEEQKKYWPSVLKEPEPYWSHSYSRGVFLLYFLNYDLLKLQIDFAGTRYGPLPGLIAPSSNEPAAMQIEGSSNLELQSNFFQGSFVLRLGKDCTVTVKDHPISLTLPQYGSVNYSIPLAYIVSTGNKISSYDIPEKVDELLAYSLGVWSENER